MSKYGPEKTPYFDTFYTVNRKLNVVRSAIFQMSQVNARSAINNEIARSHNFNVISKIIVCIIQTAELKKHDVKKF